MPLIAPCGFDCSKCPVYRATVAGATGALESLWKLMDAEARPERLEDLRCRGCLDGSGVTIPHCATCADRAAGLAAARPLA